jgi:hypothetical protein
VGGCGVEAIGEHALVGAHQLVVDLGVLDGEAGHLSHVGIAAGVESSSHDVDDLDAALIPRSCLEQLLLAGAHCSPLELLLDDLETFFDFGRIGAGAVAAQQELHHVGGHWVLAGVLADQVLADQEAIKGLGAELVELVHLAGGSGCAGHANTSS